LPGGERDQRHFVVLWYGFGQDQAAGKAGAGWQTVGIDDDRHVVLGMDLMQKGSSVEVCGWLDMRVDAPDRIGGKGSAEPVFAAPGPAGGAALSGNAGASRRYVQRSGR